MTSENRELEILDQYNYLNQVFKEYELIKKKINIFGFSQGAPVAARWIEEFQIKVNRLIFWSGNIPESIANNLTGSVNLQKPEFYIRKKDPLVSLDIWLIFFVKLTHFNPVFHDGIHFFTDVELSDFVFNL